MKKLTLILFVVLSACAEERVAPSFDSIEGWWTFYHKEASGGFELVDYAGDLMVDNGPGNGFELLGTEFKVLEKKEIIGTSKLELFLTNSSQNNVNFYEVEFNKEFTVMTAKYWTYWHNGKFKQINEPLKITR